MIEGLAVLFMGLLIAAGVAAALSERSLGVAAEWPEPMSIHWQRRSAELWKASIWLVVVAVPVGATLALFSLGVV